MATKGKLERRPTTDRVLTPGTQVRMAAMNAAAPVVTQAELCNLLEARGAGLNRSTVGFILYGRWYNENVAQALADLTGQPKAALWPEFLDAEGNLLPGATAQAQAMVKEARAARKPARRRKAAA